MMSLLPFHAILALSYVALALAATYLQTDSYVGRGFLKGFDYQVMADPTHGRVRYVDAGTASRENLTHASADHFILRADYKKALSANGPGRDSVRLQSKKKYTRSVMVFNIRHIPQGCGTWPAVWTVGADWPNHGEIDILEGVNDQGSNQVTLHTNAGCTMPSSREQTGTTLGNNCDVAVTNNAGCGVRVRDASSFGPLFNRKGGGWYAVERTESFIKVWFWPRGAANTPSDVKNGAISVNTRRWGTPVAYFPSTSCSIDSHFGPHNIIINCECPTSAWVVGSDRQANPLVTLVTFCGDWAGAVYGTSGCPSTCLDYVNKNPSAFKNAYFDFQWLKIYK